MVGRIVSYKPDWNSNPHTFHLSKAFFFLSLFKLSSTILQFFSNSGVL